MPTASSAKAKTTKRATAAGPDAIKLLKDDHDAAEALFEQFEKAKGADRKKKIADNSKSFEDMERTFRKWLKSVH